MLKYLIIKYNGHYLPLLHFYNSQRHKLLQKYHVQREVSDVSLNIYTDCPFYDSKRSVKHMFR